MSGGPAAVSFLTNIAKAAAGLGAAASLLSASLYTVDGGERAVVFDRFRGVLPETVGEGTHFIVPWLQKPYIFDIRTRPHNFSSNSGTKDLQMVNLTLRLLSRPDVVNLPTIFTSLGLEYDDKVLPSPTAPISPRPSRRSRSPSRRLSAPSSWSPRPSRRGALPSCVLREKVSLHASFLRPPPSLGQG
ncbi:unnamed protein product [Triticum turgidum subsp. durum]|uniref:Prohibitin n=1 Tax=Triticum turgidum subsp. durum TaxID=4567 RepID=A0A9R1R9F5_TRITD|nr:unnamed protein product [Triticum turgidum subsp. durum]